MGSQPPNPPATTADRRRLVVAGLATSTIEFYDFMLYGTMAALVFNQVFFPSYSPATGTLAAFATFAVGFVARPIGSIVLGRIGDRVGRKKTVMLTLLMMGGATVAIGLIPSFESIGIAAPLILVTLRFIQGFALGGEVAGVALLLVEHSGKSTRNLLGSIVHMGALGLILSSVATSFFSHISGDAFLDWGWRIPFLLSAVLFGLSFWLRRSISDSPQFIASNTDSVQQPRLSLSATFVRYWQPILLATGITGAGGVVYYTVFTYSVGYATGSLGYDRNSILNALIVAALLYTIAVPFAGWLADRSSARTVVLFGLTFSIVFVYPFFLLFEAGPIGVFVAMSVYLCFTMAPVNAPQFALYAGQFPALSRYTGTALSQAIPAAAIAGTAPFVAQYLLGVTGSNTSVAWYIAFLSVIALGCISVLGGRPSHLDDDLTASPVSAARANSRRVRIESGEADGIA
ncbi:MFS transporter [Rhodococcus sp. 15-725-2-2b]|uniref:MFS transporter n=1 Tax=unclassified Rhodococcus (in: high G+C Gram-positive bacteria) TaxID=192944 RepID=UPI000B9B09A8|nr:MULTISPECIES: MFS transporter [unclassified Rhodococcus (in: high G+C Gram-positive bacteria)]OZC63033.1 MFS transporter [Rhodococcus sp. 06-469-3-2]OZD41433.1 MFS transporter [Rhodococcus sp. 06-1477-1A]OZE06943.1 MFS transporter [Rhodococcus sp. 05-2255-3B1]OZE12771.1 MFS transporter [Rhodococcus sp. 05-2255-2A2]OZE16947.1 MFS transporter [Rhodococcus sp. 05-2255-3C]